MGHSNQHSWQSCTGGHNDLTGIVERLLETNGAGRQNIRGDKCKPLPSRERIVLIVDKLRGVVFPKCFGPEEVDNSSLRFHIGSTLDDVFHIVKEQVNRGLCFQCDGTKDTCDQCEITAHDTADRFLERIPDVATLLHKDVYATYIGDPAAIDENEVIFCYPGITAALAHRIAHELHHLGAPIIARIISEHAHSVTGIDIHPGANIGEGFMIDHGTGVVIGETCTIGQNVRIYQGVTLGAKSFPLDENGNPIKGVKRHPQIGNDVVIYSGATILGNVTVGDGAVIGGNVWLTESVRAGAKVMQSRSSRDVFEYGEGI